MRILVHKDGKIAGIAMGSVTFIIGIILILLTIFKQTRNRPWQYKKKETIINEGEGFPDDDDSDDNANAKEQATESDDSDDDKESDNFFMRENSAEKSHQVSHANALQSATTSKKRETASSPMPGPLFDPLRMSVNNEMIFCPGCNRTHPAAHQCMYSTRVANGFAGTVRATGPPPPTQDSIAIQTEEEEVKKKKKKEPHTVIDRSLKYSYTTETQTDVTAKPGPNITESVILRRVPIPTAKVVVQQPTTKVMIIKVPNTAGQLVIQPKSTGNNDDVSK